MDKSIYSKIRKEAEEEGIERYVVGAIIQDGLKVLVLKRPEHEFMGGIYELPSGKVEENETLERALQREVEEETGLELSTITSYVGHFDYDSKSGKKTRQFTFTITVKKPLEITLQEHDSYLWITKEELDLYNITDNVKELLINHWETT